MHYIFILYTKYLIIQLYYDSTNTFAEKGVGYSRMQSQIPWLYVAVALSIRQRTFCVN